MCEKQEILYTSCVSWFFARHAKQLELKAVGSTFSFKTVYVVRKTQKQQHNWHFF